ncbi:MAG: hypothetical protein D6B27_04060 [Gammaproteobacteria bacterium]|nr:MAG: hypothetical protein D6B27_04060 [Gammaproteobacteria bacterium]
MLKRIILLFALAITTTTLSVSGNAADLKVGRYSKIQPVASKQQKDPLSVIVDITFPADVVTVQDAATYLLQRSGYNLAIGRVADPMQPTLLNLTLPQIHRRLGPITLRNGLKTLSGSAWILVEDPVARLVSFELKQEYRGGGHE